MTANPAMNIIVITHIATEGPGTLGSFLESRGARLLPIPLHDGARLPAKIDDLRGIDAVISMGGPMNVYEEDAYPFLRDETEFLKEMISRESLLYNCYQQKVPLRLLSMLRHLLSTSLSLLTHHRGQWAKQKLTQLHLRPVPPENAGSFYIPVRYWFRTQNSVNRVFRSTPARQEVLFFPIY